MQTAVVWTCLLFIRSGQNHLQGRVKGGRRQGRQRKRLEDNIREWSGLEFAKSQRVVENRENGENWLWNHLWCPNDHCGYGIDDDDDDKISQTVKLKVSPLVQTRHCLFPTLYALHAMAHYSHFSSKAHLLSYRRPRSWSKTIKFRYLRLTHRYCVTVPLAPA